MVKSLVLCKGKTMQMHLYYPVCVYEHMKWVNQSYPISENIIIITSYYNYSLLKWKSVRVQVVKIRSAWTLENDMEEIFIQLMD